MTSRNNVSNNMPLSWREYFLARYRSFFPLKKNDTSNSNNLRWQFLILLIQNERPQWLPVTSFNRLKEWLLRFDVYTGLHGSFEKLNTWEKKNKLREQGQKLVNTLKILQELSIIDQKNLKIYQDMVKVTQNVIEVELTKLEIIQMHMLEKAQNIKRDFEVVPLDERRKQLKEKQKQVCISIEGRKARGLKPFSKAANDLKLNPQVRNYFRKRENKFHYNKYSKKVNKTSSSFGFLNAFNKLAANIAIAAPQLMQALAEMSTILRAIPFLGTVTFIISVLLNTSKVWIKNKNSRKKALTILTIASIIGVTVIGALAPFALGVTTVLLMIISTAAKDVYPWIKQLLEIRRKKNELHSLQEKINTNDFSIANVEKQYLMIAVEKVWLKGNIDKKQLEELKKLIITTDITLEKLENSELIKFLLIDDIKEFLIKAREERKKNLNDEIIFLRKHKNKKIVYISSGIIGITGAALLCFPTPLTVGIGISLLTISAFIGLVITFDLGTKLKNFYHKHFGNNYFKTHLLNDIKHTLQPVLDSTRKINEQLRKIADRNTNTYKAVSFTSPPTKKKIDSSLPANSIDTCPETHLRASYRP